MKTRVRLYDPFANTTWSTPDRASGMQLAHAADDIAFLPSQGQPTHVNMGEPDRRAVAHSAERSPLEAKYPVIALAITLLWGRPEMTDYFDKLWLADESSQPIDPDAMSDLMLLARLHQQLQPPQRGGRLAAAFGSDFDRLNRHRGP